MTWCCKPNASISQGQLLPIIADTLWKKHVHSTSAIAGTDNHAPFAESKTSLHLSIFQPTKLG